MAGVTGLCHKYTCPFAEFTLSYNNSSWLSSGCSREVQNLHDFEAIRRLPCPNGLDNLQTRAIAASLASDNYHTTVCSSARSELAVQVKIFLRLHQQRLPLFQSLCANGIADETVVHCLAVLYDG